MSRQEDTATVQKGFRFLDLPPELRNRIYFYSESVVGTYAKAQKAQGFDNNLDGGNRMIQGAWFVSYNPAFSAEHSTFRFPTQPNLAQVCRQLRAETLPVFYGSTGFLVFDLYTYRWTGLHGPFVAVLVDWLKRIKPYLDLMTQFEIVCAEESAVRADEIREMLADLDLGFKDGVLQVVDADDND